MSSWIYECFSFVKKEEGYLLIRGMVSLKNCFPLTEHLLFWCSMCYSLPCLTLPKHLTVLEALFVDWDKNFLTNTCSTPPCSVNFIFIAFAHRNLTLTKKMQSTLSIPKLFVTHGLGQFALMVSPLVPFQWPKFQTMISVEASLAMFWAPSTKAERLQL